MSGHLKVALALLVAGALVIVGVKLAAPYIQDRRDARTSDARATKGRVAIGYDSWVGYFPLCSPEMKRRLRQRGYVLDCVNDEANLNQRLERLKRGEHQFAVATADSYVLVGARHGYPGTIIAVIDESKGGDAIVGWRDRVASLDDFKSTRGLRLAFTPDSPSEHLIKSLAVHFDLAPLRAAGDWRVEVSGSAAALEALLAREVDAAALWEPDVSRALMNDGVHRLIGTEDMRQVIVDVLLVARRVSETAPETVQAVLESYFYTLKHYREQPDALVADLREVVGLDRAQIETLLRGVSWATLADNRSRWFGLDAGTGVSREEAIIDTLENAVDVLVEYGTIDASPIPNADPYRLTNTAPLRALPGLAVSDAPPDGKRQFAALSAAQWDALRPVGTLKMRPIVFASGTAELTGAGRNQLDVAVAHLEHYPNLRVSIDGHTGLRGDPDVNRQLSDSRAQSVARYLADVHGIERNRLRARGHGADRPLVRHPGESSRTYGYRLPRVEMVLVSEAL